MAEINTRALLEERVVHWLASTGRAWLNVCPTSGGAQC